MRIKAKITPQEKKAVRVERTKGCPKKCLIENNTIIASVRCLWFGSKIRMVWSYDFHLIND